MVAAGADACLDVLHGGGADIIVAPPGRWPVNLAGW